MFDGRRYCDAPIPLRFPNDLREIATEQEIVQRRVALVRLDDPVKKFRADNTATSPNSGNVAEVQIPLIFRARRSKKLHPLCVRNDFGRIKRVTHRIDKAWPISFEFSNS